MTLLVQKLWGEFLFVRSFTKYHGYLIRWNRYNVFSIFHSLRNTRSALFRCSTRYHPFNPNSIGVKYSLMVLCLFDLLIGQKYFFFILNWDFRSLSWLRQYEIEIFLKIKAVSLLCPKIWSIWPPPLPNTSSVKKTWKF